MRHIKIYEEFEEQNNVSKFNVGDKVYCIDYLDWSATFDPNTEYTIKDVMVYATEGVVYYQISPLSDETFWFNESRFASPDEYINLKYNI
jgi:hypothetical protein